MGVALMGTGTAQGNDRAVEAARAAISSPLLEDLSIDGAHGVLINITGGPNMTLFEVNEASTLIQEAAHEEANIIFGAVIDDEMPEDEMRVTVIATGLDHDRMRRGRDPEPEFEQHTNVMPIRREFPAEAERPTAAEEQTKFGDFSSGPALETERLEKPSDFMSPFAEDELDVPTFLRRSVD
jgi:cell division protein FtsZ